MSPALRLFLCLAIGVLAALGLLSPASAEEGWVVQRFQSDITVTESGRMEIREAITVDFGSLDRHGIIRDIINRQRCGSLEGTTGPAPVYECPAGSDRIYPFELSSVTDGSGAALQVQESTGGGQVSLRIGDPDRTVSGVQTYVIAYSLDGLLNAFEGHDELYFNVTGSQWVVPLEEVSVTVTLPDSARSFATCYEGYRSSTECNYAASGPVVTYKTTRTLFPYEELTIVAGWQKGVVDVPPPVLEDRLSPDDFFTLDIVEWLGFAGAGVLGLLGLLRVWWLFGRDRRYRTLFYLTEEADEETAPLFAEKNIVVEFLPPEDLRPAQLGVIVDERADTLDVTATIVDLAVRGYLSITELEKQGWFGKQDWRLDKLQPADDELLPYERHLFNALFRNRETVKISALKTKFHKQLAEVKKKLYEDAIEKNWFARNPETMRSVWFGVGIAVVVAGAGLSVASGLVFSRALIAVPIAIAGLVMLPFSRAMARRTAAGNEASRRALGFKLYITTAETRRQEFNEQKNIFARYLPYAIVFECVDKWADAFEGLDDQVQESTGYWYHGASAFHAGAFAAGLGSFNSSVSSTISSTPGGSGGSGFGGGSSGGGGGGGGGSSW